ncbi:exonuclease SbcCD subunit D [Arthrobacter sp. JSM 101049]|uniref:exonuclease SbcCD subunit D n=1 Tax=Arthrobacter sp. JSM 101049 TaxID=929097 RepID=UPI00356681CB
MRILHTSDWHLGRSFHGAGLLGAQRGFIDALLDTVTTKQVDVVLIAGDVYDRALPSVDAVTLFDDAVVRLREAGATVIATSGNHDSALRLGFGSRLLGRAGLHLRTQLADLDTPVVLDGDGFSVAVYGLPYLEPRMVAETLGVDAPGHPPVVRAALDRVRRDLSVRRAQAGTPVHSLVMAHVFAASGQASDSERELSIGGLDIVPIEEFADVDYAALGHLHGRQRLAETIRYSGSPMAYSFSEANHRKGAWLLEVTADGVGSIEPVDWPAARELRVLRGALGDLLADPALAGAEAAWCQVTLTDRDRPAQAMERLRARFPGTLVLHFEPEGRPAAVERTYRDRLAAAENPLEVCTGFIDHVRQRPPSEPEAELLGRILDEATSGQVAR